MARYRVLGAGFVLGDGNVAPAGAEIELDDDVAQHHPARVQRLADDAAAEAAAQPESDA